MTNTACVGRHSVSVLECCPDTTARSVHSALSLALVFIDMIAVASVNLSAAASSSNLSVGVWGGGGGGGGLEVSFCQCVLPKAPQVESEPTYDLFSFPGLLSPERRDQYLAADNMAWHCVCARAYVACTRS